MALEMPPGFPEEDWLTVLAAEAGARPGLLAALNAIPWRHARHSKFLDWDAVKAAVAQYLVALMDSFADAVCRAVRGRRFPAL